jgi:hypothetical protein
MEITSVAYGRPADDFDAAPKFGMRDLWERSEVRPAGAIQTLGNKVTAIQTWMPSTDGRIVPNG